MRLIGYIGLLGLGLGIFNTTSLAATIQVPADYVTIQEAIDAATDGDVVAIAPGTYTGDGNRDISMRNKTIRVEGTGGRDVTIIDCEGNSNDPHYGFRFAGGEGPETTISGLTISNAYVEDGSRSAAFDAFFPTVGSRGVVEDCRVTNCFRPGGTIIRGYLDVRHTIVENCSAGDVIGTWGSTIDSVEVRNNDAFVAVAVSGNAPRVLNSKVVGNTGWGIWCQEDAGASLVERTLVSGNGLGIYVNNSSPTPAIIRECSIVGNQYDAVYGEFGWARMERCVLWGNRSLGSAGSSMEWVLDCCLFPAGAHVGGGFTLVGQQTHEDPLFCEGLDWTMAPTSDGDYSVDADSPCLPDENACGLPLGALGLGTCAPASVPFEVPALSSFQIVSSLPASEHLTFRLKSPSHGTARLYDSNGRAVANKAFAPDGAQNEVTWRLERLQAGMYFLRVEQPGQRPGVQKVVLLDR